MFDIFLYKKKRRGFQSNISDAVIIGVAQVLALIPGTSRSGICMTAARMMGLERVDAARFAMLLSIPAILGAGVLKGIELWKLGDANMTMDALLAAAFAFHALPAAAGPPMDLEMDDLIGLATTPKKSK